MQLIETRTLATSEAAITFSSIPSTYTDLYLLISVRSTNGDDNLYFKFNNTTANTSWRNLLGYGTGTTAQTGSGYLLAGGVRSNTASTFTNIAIYIPNYTVSAGKSASVESTSEEDGSTAYQFLVNNLWNDNTAINRIDFYLQGGSLTQYSSVSLYGITKGSDGIVTVS